MTCAAGIAPAGSRTDHRHCYGLCYPVMEAIFAWIADRTDAGTDVCSPTKFSIESNAAVDPPLGSMLQSRNVLTASALSLDDCVVFTTRYSKLTIGYDCAPLW